MIEVVARTICQECDGHGKLEVDGVGGWYTVMCSSCKGAGRFPRVLASFADAAALREEIRLGIGCSSGDIGLVPSVSIDRAASAVLAAMGVSDG